MKFNTEKMLHGGDYNPEQWLHMPEILEKDIEMLKKSHCNVVTLGVFSWSTLEPEEGNFQFGWLRKIIDRLYENGISVVLATPSGARPKWMTDKYPEVLRVDANRNRNLFGGRHNHCYTSPVYREKVAEINRRLSEEFGSHPAVILWHISNEFGGECHCPHCQKAFQEWLKNRYKTIENLNLAWNSTFWSHTYQSFEQIESPSPRGEMAVHGLNLDWRRFVTHQTSDFIRWEVQALREGNSTLPVTANLMYYFYDLNYFELAKDIDIVSWDTYPTWHKNPVAETASDNGMCHDLMRSLKKQPFLQMESCPSSTNWQGVSKLKKPGMLFSQAMQVVAHGGDAAMYFQIRQSRGSSEKFHGAVIDHYGGEDTRVFGEVTEVGKALDQLFELCGSTVTSKAAILYDWESIWAMDDAQGPRNNGLFYKEALLKSYRALRRRGLNVDLIDMTQSLEGYEFLAVPMCYMFRDGFEKKVRAFVENGGKLVMTYWSGVVDETDLCFLGGTPHGLMDVMGLRSTEIDGLYDWERNELCPVENNTLGLTKTYTCKNLCEILRCSEATPVMTYGKDFYAGTPAVTVHPYGKGEAWYVAADAEEEFYFDLYEEILKKHQITGPLKDEIPAGVEVTTREKDGACYVIYQNFGEEAKKVPMPEGKFEVVFGDATKEMAPYGALVLKRV